jgi:murein DD-endopeptidase MepM/ murein hydrolase activator NlpD
MKKLLLFISLFLTFYMYSQQSKFEAFGGEFKINDEKTTCLTDSQREEIIVLLKENETKLKNENKFLYRQIEGSHVLFEWPVRKADNVAYNDVWAISNYLDHNQNYPNQLTDYNCGARTYDNTSGYNHKGVDIFTWPFTWKQMDNNESVVVAAASGQIIAKSDGNFDRSCSFNNNQWNAVYVMHQDGSVAWYGHLKNGSLTTKQVGQTVAVGEFLGVIGSSGNSTGPHLHFEVYQNSTYSQLIDPYAGDCNNLNTSSWWQNQKPYRNSNINAALTHNSQPVFSACPQPEISNESNQFEPGQTIFFAAYLRDQIAGTQLNLKIIKPDNTIFETWNFPLNQTYNSSYWLWSNNIFTIPGEWKWEVTYLGQTVTHRFSIGTLNTNSVNQKFATVYPNPVNAKIFIESAYKINKVTLVDMLGKTIIAKNNKIDGLKELELNEVASGVYFLTIENDSYQIQTFKIVKQ